MELNDLFNDVANVVAVTAIIPAALFVYYYGTQPREGGRGRRLSNLWKQTPIGRTLMRGMRLWVIFLAFVLHSIFLEYPGQGLARVLIYALLVAQFWEMFRTLRRTQLSPPETADVVVVPREEYDRLRSLTEGEKS